MSIATREPVIVDGKLTGHKVTTPPVYTRTRDLRGYESIQLLHWGKTVFEPLGRQRSLIDED
jgi:hypothetical protein